ncbi:MAG TPA: hypothetical protein VJI71_00380 [Candidatus Norongarragalinales archaeon]|nr:hypothetical protein [Candidatus Micrarchaeota archaeon]HLC37892.1 hypothetical protein [Candidatus Norongarragalinales archaeon]
MATFREHWTKLKENHFAMMALCCILPVIIIVALQIAGFGGAWLYTIVIGACIGGHLFMMHSALKGGKKTCH